MKYNHKGIIKDIQIVNNDLLYLNEQLQAIDDITKNNEIKLTLGDTKDTGYYTNNYVSVKDLYFTRLVEGSNYDTIVTPTNDGSYNTKNKIKLSDRYLLKNINKNTRIAMNFSEQLNLPIVTNGFFRQNFGRKIFSLLQKDKRLNIKTISTADLSSIKNILQNYKIYHNNAIAFIEKKQSLLNQNIKKYLAIIDKYENSITSFTSQNPITSLIENIKQGLRVNKHLDIISLETKYDIVKKIKGYNTLLNKTMIFNDIKILGQNDTLENINNTFFKKNKFKIQTSSNVPIVKGSVIESANIKINYNTDTSTTVTGVKVKALSNITYGSFTYEILDVDDTNITFFSIVGADSSTTITLQVTNPSKYQFELLMEDLKKEKENYGNGVYTQKINQYFYNAFQSGISYPKLSDNDILIYNKSNYNTKYTLQDNYSENNFRQIDLFKNDISQIVETMNKKSYFIQTNSSINTFYKQIIDKINNIKTESSINFFNDNTLEFLNAQNYRSTEKSNMIYDKDKVSLLNIKGSTLTRVKKQPSSIPAINSFIINKNKLYFTAENNIYVGDIGENNLNYKQLYYNDNYYFTKIDIYNNIIFALDKNEGIFYHPINTDSYSKSILLWRKIIPIQTAKPIFDFKIVNIEGRLNILYIDDITSHKFMTIVIDNFTVIKSTYYNVTLKLPSANRPNTDFKIIDVDLKTGQTNQYDYRFINNKKYYTATIVFGGSSSSIKLSTTAGDYKSIQYNFFINDSERTLKKLLFQQQQIYYQT